MQAPLLAVHGVGKRFPGVVALQDVDLVLRSGEVLALIGENGAGKSTLMKILAGVLLPDQGEVLLDGEPCAFTGPGDALAAGIALIHQELELCDNLTVAGALFLGSELRVGPFLRERAMHDKAAQVLARTGLGVPTTRLVSSLAPGQKQLLEIARAVRLQARVLIMDEPTSSLTQQETDRLFAVVGELSRQGVGVIHISHRLGEVAQIAHRVVVLRDGRNAGELDRASIDHDRMVALMVGRQLRATTRRAHVPGAVALQVQALRTAAYPGAVVSFAVRAREIVGIAGLLGAGRSEILRALVGADPRLSGTVEVAGCAVPGSDPAASARLGLVLVPEDRKVSGLVLGMNVRENLSLPSLRGRGVFVDRVYERELAGRSIRDLGITTPSAEQVTAMLSGGNQQKVVLGKWLACAPKVLLLDEPTRGVDVGARGQIYERLQALAEQGLAVLFVSSDLEEVLALADRVLVVHEGRIAGELPREALGEQAVMALATGKGVA